MKTKNVKRKPWTPSDVRSLKAMLRQKFPARRIARTFRRTEGAVRQKVHSIGLGFTRPRRTG